ncbi:phospholipase A [Agaribacterium haliotis]|uniref:phospholipase A n=1 Tax=Agaribacterium haliotis TaxID=2013869 RepID=UPI000BB5488B|nr:phospholipase A [Agaribacterium haliotis]
MLCFRYRTIFTTCFAIPLLNFSLTAHAQNTGAFQNNKQQTDASYNNCILTLVDEHAHLSAEKITSICTDVNELEPQQRESTMAERIVDEKTSLYDPFSLTAHKPNYVLPLSYNANHNSEHYDSFEEFPIQDVEMQFQVSVKFPLWSNIYGKDFSFLAAYSARSFWQAYNSDFSRLFRDTNYEPEAWLEWHPNDYALGSAKLRWLRGGFVHQSNGQAGGISRSWNRIFAEAAVDWRNYMFSLKPWYRLPEPEDEDDNPDIEQYLGNFEFLTARRFGEHTVSMMLRNNLRRENKGAVELSWSIPMGEKVKAYVKYFNGYGETMLNYDHRSERYSLGFVVADWL